MSLWLSLSLLLSLSLYATNLWIFHHVLPSLVLSYLVLSCVEWTDKYYYCYYRHDVVWARVTLSYQIISYLMFFYFIFSAALISIPFYFILFYSTLFQIDSIRFDSILLGLGLGLGLVGHLAIVSPVSLRTFWTYSF